MPSRGFTKILAGTSGFSYKEWKGSFYPEDLPANKMLGYYAGRFGTVEINNTFYRLPDRTLLARWSEEVPQDFVFVLKASRRTTHQQRLEGSAETLRYFFESASVLGARLGPVLVQLPPFLKKDATRLREFLSLVPAGRRVAVEFRNATWFDDEVYETLRSHGAALCVADSEEHGADPLVATAPWGYLRLRRQDYTEEGLARWAGRIREQAWQEVCVFFKHEDAGRGPELAARFLELAK